MLTTCHHGHSKVQDDSYESNNTGHLIVMPKISNFKQQTGTKEEINQKLTSTIDRMCYSYYPYCTRPIF